MKYIFHCVDKLFYILALYIRVINKNSISSKLYSKEKMVYTSNWGIYDNVLSCTDKAASHLQLEICSRKLVPLLWKYWKRSWKSKGNFMRRVWGGKHNSHSCGKLWCQFRRKMLTCFLRNSRPHCTVSVKGYLRSLRWSTVGTRTFHGLSMRTH